MAYGDYDGPNKPDKAEEGGSCNRTRCQCSPALWLNHANSKWYCRECARDIGMDAFNYRDWKTNYEPKYGHPMFETREMIDAREEAKRPPEPIEHLSEEAGLRARLAEFLKERGL